MDGDAIWAASGSFVSKFLRGKQVFYAHSHAFQPGFNIHL
jgi:hypothetical protein